MNVTLNLTGRPSPASRHHDADLYFKFTGADESVYILGMEPWEG